MEKLSEGDRRYPWYDSIWLSRYVRAKALIQRVRPDKLAEFADALECLKTGPDFQVKQLADLFDDDVMNDIKYTIRTFPVPELELHEVKEFGRFVVHNHPFITKLQRSTIDLVSRAVGEAVDISYNFVSLYKKLGVCPIHMDSPESKWTLDLCIEQSDPWPIHLSQVVPWPEDFTCPSAEWKSAIMYSPKYQFSSHTLEPGKALIFSGSSQWHYRDCLTPDRKERFCHLVFFHFVPKGMCDYVKPKNWPRLFGIPELADILMD